MRSLSLWFSISSVWRLAPLPAAHSLLLGRPKLREVYRFSLLFPRSRTGKMLCVRGRRGFFVPLLAVGPHCLHSLSPFDTERHLSAIYPLSLFLAVNESTFLTAVLGPIAFHFPLVCASFSSMRIHLSIILERFWRGCSFTGWWTGN